MVKKMKNHWGVVCFFVGLVLPFLGCHHSSQAVENPEQEAQTSGEETSAESLTQPDESIPETASEPEETPAKIESPSASEPIDLLRGVRTDLAVSTAYRNRRAQAEQLVDGDLETAWNSKTKNLVGAWIDVRLPENVKVSSIVLTAGFTKTKAKSDLFTGNHRVSKVRVLHEGQELGVYELDIESRELQTIPVKGPGGVYRVEIAEVVPGTKNRWKEICISELRFMGFAPKAHKGKRYPRIQIGKLPEPRPEPGTADRAKVRPLYRSALLTFSQEWYEFERELGTMAMSSGQPDPDEEQRERFPVFRRNAIGRVAKLVELVDEVQGDGLRYAATQRCNWRNPHWSRGVLQGDLDRIIAGFKAVADWLGEQDDQCRLAREHARLRLGRVTDELGVENLRCNHRMFEASMHDDPYPISEEERQYCDEVMREYSELRFLNWSRDPRKAAAKLRQYKMSVTSSQAGIDLDKLNEQLEILRRDCGWGGKKSG